MIHVPTVEKAREIIQLVDGTQIEDQELTAYFDYSQLNRSDVYYHECKISPVLEDSNLVERIVSVVRDYADVISYRV